MADGPNIDTSYLYRQTQQAQGGSGCAPLLLGARLDCNVGGQLTLQGRGLNLDGMIRAPKQAPNGPIAGLLRQMNFNGASIIADLQKVAQGAGVMYSGDLPSGSLPGSGGSFASMAVPSIGDDHSIG